MFERRFSFTMLAVMLCFTHTGTMAQDDVTLPALTGPYQVGQATFHLIDSSREEIFTEDPSDVRQLMLTVFYPAQPPDGVEPALYIVNDTLRAHEAESFLPGFLDNFHAHSFVYVPVSLAEEGYPVLVFLPGLFAIPPYYTSILEDLASHGYVVAATWHPYSSPATVFPNERIVEGNVAGQGGADGTGWPDVIETWSNDTRFVLTHLDFINHNDFLLAGSMDLSRLGIVGHSIGGTTTITVLQSDNRFLAGAVMDYIPVGDMSGDVITQPVMFMQRQGNVVTVRETVEQGYVFTLMGAGHETFGDGPFLAPVAHGVLDVGTLDGTRALDAINTYLLAFFDKHLKGDGAPLLDGPSPDYEEVSFEILD